MHGDAAHLPPLFCVSDSVVLEVRDLTKIYAGQSLAVLLRSRHTNRMRSGPGAAGTTVVTALGGISFALAEGTSLGVIGRNGAGKSTLLRILAGLSAPTSGSVDRRGSSRALLELGAGMLDELTGRENATAALALDGVAARERRRQLAAVEEFADIGGFFERPVRTYSNGMRLRLGYALAIATQPDILIADEILAVGDEDFQRKCSQHVQAFLGEGRTLVLASHSLYHVEKLCQLALWLEQGRPMAFGPAREVTAAYKAEVEVTTGAGEDGVAPTSAERRAPAPRGWALEVPGTTSDARARVRLGGAVSLSVVAAEGCEPLCDAAVRIVRPDGTVVVEFGVAGAGTLHLQRLPLLPGRYTARLCANGGRTAIADVGLDCVGESRELGSVRLEHEWSAPQPPGVA